MCNVWSPYFSNRSVLTTTYFWLHNRKNVHSHGLTISNKFILKFNENWFSYHSEMNEKNKGCFQIFLCSVLSCSFHPLLSFLSILNRWPRLYLPSCWLSSSRGHRITSWYWSRPSASPASLTLCGLLATGYVTSTLLSTQLVTHCAMPHSRRHSRTCCFASIKI